MELYENSKLSLTDVLSVGSDSVERIYCRDLQEVPWCFLKKLMALNRDSRITCLQQDNKDPDVIFNDWDSYGDSSASGDDNADSVHPLDVLCVVLHCSDPFLQQEILLKMSMCQFAVPLLMPLVESPGYTFMLWAMRDIVKRWSPLSEDSKVFKEKGLVHISMPVFSFIRLGACRLSKSKTLNRIISPANEIQDFFLHREMEAVNVSRTISDGLVEISWHFPGANKKSDNQFNEPIAVTNLRGDILPRKEQYEFLNQVSSAVFIFTEGINEMGYELLANTEHTGASYCIIIAPSSQSVSDETQRYIKMLQPKLNLNRRNVLVKNNSVNDAELAKKLKLLMMDFMNGSQKKVNLEQMSGIAKGLNIVKDQNSPDVKKGRKCAEEIVGNIKDVVSYKEETLTLQGELWKEISQIEKEMCRMRNQGHENAEDYRAELERKRSNLRRRQSEHPAPQGIVQFHKAVTGLTLMEKKFFFKWTKLYLDSIARDNLRALRAQYKEILRNSHVNTDQLKQIDQRMSDSSLGIEHFLREFGQFYEAKYSMSSGCSIESRFSELPGIVADLLLDGFPLELIDGDASNIPLKWLSDILNELDTKTGHKCRMRVITVLGVQSTGKSTLLNTMFGLQFSVSSGRCTRGAFMTLIKVKETFQAELGCEFILVIDTEGLKAPELASLEDSYGHDNELATLAIGLSDITLINMMMENTAEMKDILQLVIHAFLRMKEIGKKPNCHFVHQNVSDVSAHDKNLRGRQKLLQQLDEMTKIAAKLEKKEHISKFSDILDSNLEEHTWYIPSLWYGIPPMASVNSGYSENVYELKRYLISYMKKLSSKAQTIPEFTEWIKSLWNAIKHEKFIFSFRNSLVSEAYNNLCMRYTDWEWRFQGKTYTWFIETENFIKNLSVDKLDREIIRNIQEEMRNVLKRQETIMLRSLEEYFNSDLENVHLLETFQADFFQSVQYFRKAQEVSLWQKCENAIRAHEEKCKIQKIQSLVIKIIEDKVTAMIENWKNNSHQLDDDELMAEFEEMWGNAVEG
ncbi:hypothetical protein GDO86_019802, partial [Hymenochirus boettgeri]